MSHEVGRPNALSSAQVDRAIVMLAAGFPQHEVAQTFGVARQTIWKYLKSPDAQEQLQAWRDQIKTTIIRRAAEGTVARAFDMADRAIKDDDKKGFDATTRGIAALEKATASASGEGRKVEVSGPEGAPMALDVRALIGALVDDLRRDA